jgi:hypothetical protein
MTPQRFLFLPFLILLNSYCYSQILNDSTICLNPTQVKIINLAFNELQKMNELNDTKDTLLTLKEKRIEILNFQLDTRSNQLIEVNVDHMRLEKVNKRLKFQLLCWKITTIVGIITTILIFK